MSDINVCVFSGNLVRDAEVRVSANGNEFMTFTLAVNDYGGKDKDDITSYLDFISNNTAIAQYLIKGRKITVQANARQNKYQNREGKEVSKINFSARQILLPPKEKREPYQEVYQEPIVMDDDIPF